MEFSQFLKKIYKYNTLYARQDLFLKALFESTGREFYYSEDYLKRIFNGQKPLSNDVKTRFKGEINLDIVKSFFQGIINAKRLNELADDFGIPADEERDFEILCEALVERFFYYVNLDEDENKIIPFEELYLTRLDSQRNGNIKNADERAYCEAMSYYIQAINAIASIKSRESVFLLTRPFENFFDSIFKMFKAYNHYASRKGRFFLKAAKEKVLDGSQKNVDSYLQKITEPGSSPVKLEKEIVYRVYDNVKFQDSFIEKRIKYNDSYSYEDILNDFKSLDFHEFNEYYFTEIISFREEKSNINLMVYAKDIIYRIGEIVDLIRLNLCLKDYSDFEILWGELKEATSKLKRSEIQYITDGVYFPVEDRIEYALSFQVSMTTKEGYVIEPGNTLFNQKNHFVLQKIGAENFRNIVFDLHRSLSLLWKNGGFGLPMIELFTINANGTYRHFLVPPSSKARLYRLIRDVVSFVRIDDMVGFIINCVMNQVQGKDNDDFLRLLNMPTEQRFYEETAEDIFVSVGYSRGESASAVITKGELQKGKRAYSDTSIERMPALLPLVVSIAQNNTRFKKKS